ncbi:universal stress family protein [Lentilactobacillus kisonensis DSM 19906 = JCM 15041]|uniref:Universal stress family protein n=2 Tax=Lentilactobacillus kisonensis TaxID=481722 RepID=H1LFR1_9LACO|nr:universal stress family protein [Lentilactobacillus kisonensis F0435]KRL23136.1 universal stress family protein [Lentilactobacillus kisonensis DSM 19906 = JCM 15041]
MSAGIYEGLTARAHHVLEGSKDQAQNQGITVEGTAKNGSPKHMIVKFAKVNNYDLIVLGKSGTNAINRFILGSTSEYVARNANAHVLVVSE